MSSRGKDNSVLVAKLKRQINKKQLLHGELTQQYNNVRQEHTTLEIAFQTTLEQIESMKDRTAVAASELKDRATVLGKNRKLQATLEHRLAHPGNAVETILDEIYRSTLDDVLDERYARILDESVEMHKANAKAVGKKLRKVQTLESKILGSKKVQIQNAVALDVQEHMFGHMVKDTAHRTKDFFVTDHYTFDDIVKDAIRYWGEPEVSNGMAKIYGIADESGAFFMRSDNVVETFRGCRHMEDMRLFLLEVYHIPLVDLIHFDVDFKEIHWTQLERSLEKVMAQRLLTRNPSEGLFALDEVMKTNNIVIRDILVYLLFCAVLVFKMIARRDVAAEYGFQWSVGQALNIETHFKDIQNIQDWWAWAEGPLAMALQKGTGGGKRPGKGFIHTYGYPVGGIRIRQVRVQSDCSAKLDPQIIGKFIRGDRRLSFSSHYGAYDRWLCYDAEPFGPLSRGEYSNMDWTRKKGGFVMKGKDDANFPASMNNVTRAVYKGFYYQPDPYLVASEFLKSHDDPTYFDTNIFTGRELEYGGGGFAVEFHSNDLKRYLEMLRQLRSNEWLDSKTRAIVVLLNVYNPNTHVFAPVQLITERFMSGYVHTIARITVLKTDFYHSIAEKFHALFDLLCFVCIAYFLKIERLYYDVAWRKVNSNKVGPLTEYQHKVCGTCRVWFFTQHTLYEMLIYLMYFSSSILRISAYNDEKKDLSFSLHFYRDLTSSAYRYHSIFILDSLMLLFLALKMFRYVKLSDSMNVLIVSLQSGKYLLAGYVIIFSGLMTAFALFGHTIFGKQLEEFSEPMISVRTMIMVLFGKLDYGRIEEVDPVMAPTFFFLFEIIIYFVSINMFLAIVNYLYLRTSKLFSSRPSNLIEGNDSFLQLWIALFFPWLGEHNHFKMVTQDKA